MGFIVAIPGVIAFIIASSRGIPFAFLNVYLPVMLLLPDYYRWVLPALPDPTFGEAAIVPLAVMFISRYGKDWRFSFADFLVFGFVASMVYSEFINANFGDAQNLLFDLLGEFAFPYMLAKGLIEPRGLRVEFAKKFVMMLFWICVVSIYEFRFGKTPWQMFMGGFFPGQGDGWVTTFRWGFARVAGPYGHAILAGLILIVGFRINRWLEWSNLWEAKSKRFPNLPWSKARTLTIALLGGVIMTMVRGPWTGGFMGALLTWVGRAKNRKMGCLVVLGSMLCVGVPIAVVFYQYASVGRANAKSDSQETAAYRKELLDKYIAIAAEKSVWGWGTNSWPKVDGMPSIDNYYLLLALMHGTVSLFFLFAILVSMIVRLTLRGMMRPPPAMRGGSLAFTLAGIHVVIFITIATVFMGGQVVPIFALMTGWGEGYLLADNDSIGTPAGAPKVAPVSTAPFRFRRVVA